MCEMTFKHTVWFVSRHRGARDFARHKGIPINRWEDHIDTNSVHEGDTVYGTLPLIAIYELNRRSIPYFHLVMPLDESQRGKEISLVEMLAKQSHFRQVFITLGT